MGFVRDNGQGRFFVTDEGKARHAREVLKVAEGAQPASARHG